MKKILVILILIVLYVPMLLLTFILNGLVGVKVYMYDIHQILKSIFI